VEDLVMFLDAFRGRTVWVSGHTGFKGAWLTFWLHHLGARVVGFSLAPCTQPNLFTQLGLADALEDQRGDVRDANAVRRSLEAAQPDYVLHLAAQALVRPSYDQPVTTFATNVLGTLL
jgi:CDP-glucose 4,6-dehydratase